MARTAASASTRPAPAAVVEAWRPDVDGVWPSTCRGPRPGVRNGLRSNISAAIGGECGAAADVPKNDAKPGTAVADAVEPRDVRFGARLAAESPAPPARAS